MEVVVGLAGEVLDAVVPGEVFAEKVEAAKEVAVVVSSPHSSSSEPSRQSESESQCQEPGIQAPVPQINSELRQPKEYN